MKQIIRNVCKQVYVCVYLCKELETKVYSKCIYVLMYTHPNQLHRYRNRQFFT